MIAIIQLFLLVFSIMFFIWFAIKRAIISKASAKNDDDFWRREAEANSVRKRDLDTVEYINFPLEDFPISKHTESTILEFEEILLSMKDKRFLNLAGKTATDLKFEYGVTNLTTVSEYEENYIQMIKTVHNYAEALIENGYDDDAAIMLEYSISIGSDLKSSYMLLAKIYSDRNDPQKIHELISSAEKLESLMKNPIIKALNSLLETDFPSQC